MDNGRNRISDAENSLEKIKKQLNSASGRFLLQGPLLKRSETLRKWNERWVTLDPTTGKMEYRTRRNELTPKGTIIFDANSTITLSPLNIHGLQKYDGCCFYIGTPQKNEYFLCAETPTAAKAWVSTLRASQLVLKAHREAVNSLSGNGSSMIGTVAAAVSAANATAKESAKEIEAAMQITMKVALGSITNQNSEKQMDNMTIMKETLQVKDEELHQLARELRARDATIKEIADKLSQTAEAAESAALAAHAMDNERRAAVMELQKLSKEKNEIVQITAIKLKDLEKMVASANKERDNFAKQREAALQEAHLWRSELAKARECAVIMEAALVRAEEKAKIVEVNAEARVKEAIEKQISALNDKEETLKEVSRLKTELRRSHPSADELKHVVTAPINTDDQKDITNSRQLDNADEAENTGVTCLSTDIEQTETNVEHELHAIPDSQNQSDAGNNQIDGAQSSILTANRESENISHPGNEVQFIIRDQTSEGLHGPSLGSEESNSS